MNRTLTLELERRFPGGPAIRAQLDLDLEGAPVTVLFGPSGAGKTTLLRCIAGLDRPDAGAIRFAGQAWFDAAGRVFVPPQRRNVGLLFQDHALFPHLSVAENVAYGLGRAGRAEREARVLAVAALLGIQDLLGRRPRQLSGGQRQRVALARALAPRPQLLLLDEPLSALDAPSRAALQAELRATLKASGVPSVVVTHDRVEALALGDRMAVLAEGSIRQVGSVHQVFSAPADLVVARAVGAETVLPARLLERADGLVTLEVGRSRLVAVDPGRIEGQVYACVRAEDVLIEPAQGSASSARNHLAGRVTSLAHEGALVRVALDCGFPLVALVTRQAAEQLALAPGAAVAAQIKATALRLVPRGVST
jgi:molybdate transport system ATP-binding protein